MPSWTWFLILGSLVLVSCLVLLFFPKHRPDAPLVGLATVGFALIGLYIVQPESLKFQGIELVSRVDRIEKNLRPFAVIEIGSAVLHKSEGLLYQTFKNGEFTWPKQKGGEKEYKFVLKSKPKFVEVRCDQASTSLHDMKQTKDGFEYTFSFTFTTYEKYVRCIVEAFIE